MSNIPIVQTISLFKDKRPSSCFLDQVYDPDVDGPWIDDESFPRVIPLEGATIIERETGHLYYAKHVDPDTYKTTLGYTRIVVDAGDGDSTEEIKVISYGNDRYTLFVNHDHQPTQLTVSSNFVLFGSNLTRYQLLRYTEEGDREVISMYLDSDESYSGNLIPLLPIAPGSAIKHCTNCHTTFKDIKDGDTIIMDVFDHAGILVMTIRLLVRNSVAINDLASDSDMLVGMDANALQELSDGTFYLYPMQDPTHLGVTPYLIHQNGQQEVVAVDERSCYMYGLEGFVPAFTGQRQKIVLKKFLGPKQYSDVAQTIGGSRYLTCEKWVTVVPRESLDTLKVSVLPIWNSEEGNYYLKYIAYSDKRDKVYDVSYYVKIIKPVNTGSFGEIQELQIEIDLSALFNTSTMIPFSQDIYLNFQPHSALQRYIISDTEDMTVVYGVESSTKRRPVIHYDTSLGRYFIPTSRFRNKEAVLDAFYYSASPPLNTISEIVPPVPTHFTVRGIDNLSTIISTPIPMEQFNRAWLINRVGDPSILLGHNVLVEFLRAQGEEYQILYGVPVDVYTSTTGYLKEPDFIPIV